MGDWIKIKDEDGNLDYSFNTIEIDPSAYTLESITGKNFGALILGTTYDSEIQSSCTYAYPVGQCYNQENSTFELDVTLVSISQLISIFKIKEKFE